LLNPFLYKKKETEKMKSIYKITIPKRITEGEELIVIRRQEYD